MTTCPNCNRRLATRAQLRALRSLTTGCGFDGAVCYRLPLGDGVYEYDAYCGRLAADLRARADAALLDAARCFPPGFLSAVAAVLIEGARVKGCEPHESGGGQSLDDHLQHAIDHLLAADNALSKPGATECDEDDLTHAAARCALAWATRAK